MIALGSKQVAGSSGNNKSETHTVLYDNSTGITGNITLSESVNNYKYVEIFHTQYQGYQNSTKVDLTITNKITLMNAVWLSNQGNYNGFYIDTKQITIADNQITVNGYGSLYYNDSGCRKENQNNINIHKVIAYN